MADNIYWLISITSTSARVTLVNQNVASQGQEILWDPADPESLLKAIDTSLSALDGDSTSNCAFIVPPSWVSEDGKIFGEMLKKLKLICDSLKLRPLGFISHDDAFVESYNHDDSFPGSYILVYFGATYYQISLVYLGQIKKRQVQDFGSEFSVKELEQTLFNLEFSSALPPKIILIGTYTQSIVEDIKNYNWLSHPDIETFLHLPDVISIDILSLDQIYTDTIHKQIVPPTDLSASPIIDVDPIVDPEPIQIDEVEASTLGFTIDDSPIDIVSPPVVEEIKPHPKKPTFHFSFPKINLNYYWLLPLTLLPFLPVLPLFFAKVDLIIYQNPVDFNETFDVTLNPNSNVSSKTFDLSVGASIATTGKKEVGTKAKGEIAVFNKLDKSISVNKGLIITDGSGKKFETTNNILLPGSTYNLDTGVITMGQVKAAVIASDIGPEYNLSANVSLTPKDNPNLLAKSTLAFTGGTKEEIAVVTQNDKLKLIDSSKQLLRDQAKTEINSQKSPENTILDSTMVFENQKQVFNREVGEDADILTLDLTSKVSFLYFDLRQKQEMISTLFPQKTSLSSLDKNSAVVTLNYTSGKLTMTGKANPTIDINRLKTQLTAKSESDLKSILNTLPRYYQHQLINSLSFINILHRLPIKSDMINIVIKN